MCKCVCFQTLVTASISRKAQKKKKKKVAKIASDISASAEQATPAATS